MKILKRLYDKSEIWFSVTWIVAYCLLMSLGDGLSQKLGVESSISFVTGLALSAVLLCFLKKYGMLDKYGLCLPSASHGSMLYYIPLLLLISVNFMHGVGIYKGALETVFFILSMLSVGFLEEVIFRGLLFGAMEKDTPRAAVVVSSLTFGFGHIINLINGSGMELIPNLLQVVYATAAGFMFVMIYKKSKSLVACIITHGVFNAIGVFSNQSITTAEHIAACLLLTAISLGYSLYLWLGCKNKG